MLKRKYPTLEQDFSKKLKITPTRKRQASEHAISTSKRPKLYQYWHEAPLTREQRAFNMAKIYEHLLLCT